MGSVEQEIESQYVVKQVRFTPDGSSVGLVTESSEFLLFRYFPTGKLPRLSVSTGGDIFDFDFFPFFTQSEPLTQSVLVASRNRPVQLVSCVSGLPVSAYTAYSFTEEIVHPLTVKFSPQGGSIVGAFAQSTLRLWDVQRPGRQERDLVLSTRKGQGTQKGIISAVCFAGEETIFAGSYSRDIFMYDLRDKARCMQIGGGMMSEFGGVVQLDFLQEKNLLVSGHRMDTSLYVWDVRSPDTALMELPRATNTHQRFSHSVFRDRFVFCGDSYGDLTVFDLDRNGDVSIKHKIADSPVVSVSAVADGDKARVACGYGCRSYSPIPDSSDEDEQMNAVKSGFSILSLLEF